MEAERVKTSEALTQEELSEAKISYLEVKEIERRK